MSYLIAGYNTSSKKEKEKYDEKKLCKYISMLLIISSCVLILGSILSYFMSYYDEKIIVIMWTLYTIIILFGVIHVNITTYVRK
jgi:membrane protein YdbS with pleckstrin-like domain